MRMAIVKGRAISERDSPAEDFLFWSASMGIRNAGREAKRERGLIGRTLRQLDMHSIGLAHPLQLAFGPQEAYGTHFTRQIGIAPIQGMQPKIASSRPSQSDRIQHA